MAESVYNSYKIIAVLSSNFLESNYCNYELNIAKYRLLNKRDNSLVMIRIDNEDCSKLPRELRERSFIDYSNPMERPLWERKLLRFLNIVPDDSSNHGTPDETVQQNCDNVESGRSAKDESYRLNSAKKPMHVVYDTPALIQNDSQQSQSDDFSVDEQETVL